MLDNDLIVANAWFSTFGVADNKICRKAISKSWQQSSLTGLQAVVDNQRPRMNHSVTQPFIYANVTGCGRELNFRKQAGGIRGIGRQKPKEVPEGVEKR